MAVKITMFEKSYGQAMLVYIHMRNWQARHVYPQTRKSTRIAAAERMLFLLVEALPQTPCEQNVLVTHAAATRFFKSLVRKNSPKISAYFL